MDSKSIVKMVTVIAFAGVIMIGITSFTSLAREEVVQDKETERVVAEAAP